MQRNGQRGRQRPQPVILLKTYKQERLLLGNRRKYNDGTSKYKRSGPAFQFLAIDKKVYC